MSAPKPWKLIPVVLTCCVAGVASAKLPAPPADPAKAAAAKEKAAAAAKKDAELLGKAQDRAAENYKKKHKAMAAARK